MGLRSTSRSDSPLVHPLQHVVMHARELRRTNRDNSREWQDRVAEAPAVPACFLFLGVWLHLPFISGRDKLARSRETPWSRDTLVTGGPFRCFFVPPRRRSPAGRCCTHERRRKFHTAPCNVKVLHGSKRSVTSGHKPRYYRGLRRVGENCVAGIWRPCGERARHPVAPRLRA